MFALKLLSFMALACVAMGTDLETGYQIMACAQRVISNGVPELRIPSHTPLHQVHNFTTSAEAYNINFDFNLTNAVWGGIPLWKLNATQLSKDSDDYAVFKFTLWWDWFNIKGDYGANFSVDLFNLGTNFSGTFDLAWRDITWEGQLNFTKHSDTNNLTATCNAANITWSVTDLDASVTGFGWFDWEMGGALGQGLKYLLNSRVVTIGEFIRAKINDVWWDTGRIYEVIDWCKANPANQTTF